MKKTSLLLYTLLLVVFTACEKPDVKPTAETPAGDEPTTEDIYKNSPSSSLPSDFKNGIWFWGRSGSFSYYDNDGNHVGDDIEAGRQYRFKEVNGQGRLEFQQYLGFRNASNCVTEYYTHMSGTVKFEEPHKLTFYPVEGTIKTVKSSTYDSCPKGTTNEVLTPDKLIPINMLYKINVVNGEKYLSVFGADDVDFKQALFVYSRFNS